MSFRFPFSMAGTKRFLGEGLSKASSNSSVVSFGNFVFRGVSMLFKEEFENFLIRPVSQYVSYSTAYKRKQIFMCMVVYIIH